MNSQTVHVFAPLGHITEHIGHSFSSASSETSCSEDSSADVSSVSTFSVVSSESESIELASCRRMNYLLLLAAPNFISKALFKQARLRDVPVQLFNKISLAK